jgi:parallel beta-helix repeat protein
MRKTKNKLINLILLVSLLFFSLVILDTTTLNNATISSIDNTFHLDYTAHAPIEIISNDNFTDYGFPGDGTETNPYRIEDLYIDLESGYGIFVEYVTMHFVIQNCLIEGASNAIYLHGVSWNSCRVEHNILNDVEKGIHIESVTNGTFLNNTINANYIGIEVDGSGYVALINNTISDTYNSGIYIDDGGTIVTGNKLYNSGIHLSTQTLFTFGVMDTLTIANNTVNDKPIIFFKNLDDIIVSSADNYGQIFLYNCQRATISHQELNNCTDGIQASRCDNMTVHDCLFFYNDFSSIDIYDSDFLYVHNCDFRYNTYDAAIDLYACHNALFFDNNFEKVYALLIQASDNVQVMGNDFFNVTHALYTQYTNNLTFNENWILESTNAREVYMYWSEFAEIYDNMFYKGYMGVSLDKVNNATIYNNLFQEHSSVAIKLTYETENCTIYHNTFIDNDWLGFYSYSHAYDNGTNNLWYNETLQEGNYWDDWTSGPYAIFGEVGSQDLYPLGSPTVTPFIPEFNKTIITSFFIIPLVVCITLLIKRKKKRNKS